MKNWIHNTSSSIVSALVVAGVSALALYIWTLPVLAYDVACNKSFQWGGDGRGGFAPESEQADYTVILTNLGVNPIDGLSVRIWPQHTRIVHPVTIGQLQQVEDFKPDGADAFEFRLKYLNPGDPVRIRFKVAPQHRAPGAGEVVVEARAKGVTAKSRGEVIFSQILFGAGVTFLVMSAILLLLRGVVWQLMDLDQ